MGGLYQSSALVVLGFLYNDCGGADMSCISHDLINGADFVCYTQGAMKTTLGVYLKPTDPLTRWFVLICLMVSTSVHT